MNKREMGEYVKLRAPEFFEWVKSYQDRFNATLRHAQVGDVEWGEPAPKGVPMSVEQPIVTKGRKR